MQRDVENNVRQQHHDGDGDDDDAEEEEHDINDNHRYSFNSIHLASRGHKSKKRQHEPGSAAAATPASAAVARERYSSTESVALDDLPPWALKPRNEQRPRMGDDNMLQTVFAIFKSFVGCGILFLPSGFHFAGWAGSVVLLCFAAVLNLCGIIIPWELMKSFQKAQCQKFILVSKLIN